MANARLAIGSLFGAVVAVADTTTGTLNTVSKSVGMLETFVDDAARDQKDRSAANAEMSMQKISEDLALEMSEREQMVLKYTSQSAAHAESFKSNYDRILASIKKSRGLTEEA